MHVDDGEIAVQPGQRANARACRAAAEDSRRFTRSSVRAGSRRATHCLRRARPSGPDRASVGGSNSSSSAARRICVGHARRHRRSAAPEGRRRQVRSGPRGRAKSRTGRGSIIAPDVRQAGSSAPRSRRRAAPRCRDRAAAHFLVDGADDAPLDLLVEALLARTPSALGGATIASASKSLRSARFFSSSAASLIQRSSSCWWKSVSS